MEIKQGNKEALDQFYKKIKSQGTPLIESFPENENFKLVTFLWIESLANVKELQKPIKNVIVIDGIAGEDFKSNQLKKIEHTDIWYKSFIAKSDTRTIYSFSINDPLLSEGEANWAEHISSHYTLDPLNTKSIGNDSILELPDAPSEIWLQKREDIESKGKIIHHKFKSQILQN